MALCKIVAGSGIKSMTLTMYKKNGTDERQDLKIPKVGLPFKKFMLVDLYGTNLALDLHNNNISPSPWQGIQYQTEYEVADIPDDDLWFVLYNYSGSQADITATIMFYN